MERILLFLLRTKLCLRVKVMGVLRYVKGMDICWHRSNRSLSACGEIQGSSVGQDRGSQIQIQGTRDG
jgi:hypothetical protein